MTDRPATEPRTEAGRALLGYFLDYRPASDPHRPDNREKARALILAIEAEAAQGAAPAEFASDIADIINDERATEIVGAAPRAEGLDVLTVHRILCRVPGYAGHDNDPTPWPCESFVAEYARLSRPSDERD